VCVVCEGAVEDDVFLDMMVCSRCVCDVGWGDRRAWAYGAVVSTGPELVQV